MLIMHEEKRKKIEIANKVKINEGRE